MQKVFFFVIIVFGSITTFGQPVSIDFIKKVDSIFSDFNQDTPGCAIAIVHKDSIVLFRSYGLANLEHRIPINAETVFNVASLSKQFTGMGVALLARQGKVNLDEDIRHYLPWIPDFTKRISIRHLLHHTSGIRDHIIMSILGGVPGNGMLTQDIAIKYIKNYKALNFSPGENHAYSNSNYVLLAEIIKKVSGQSFNQFMDSAIFKPLAMRKSAFLESTSLIKDGASSYNKIGNAFNPVMMNIFSNGDGGLTSTINDMSKWIRNFLDPKVGDGKLVQQMVAPFYLINGKMTNYGMGIGAVNFQGHTQYTHSGSVGGFRSAISIYPDLGFGVIVLSNHANGRAILRAGQVVEHYLNEIKAYKQNKAFDATKATFSDSALARKISGNYMSENGARFTFQYKDNRLLFQNNEPLIANAPNDWAFATDSSVTFSLKIAGKDTIIHHFNYGTNYLLTKYRVDSVLSPAMLQDYVGSYYNNELDLSWDILSKSDKLYLSNFLHGEIGLQPITKDDLYFRNGVTHLRILRNAKKNIYGFEYSNATLTKLKFIKKGNN